MTRPPRRASADAIRRWQAITDRAPERRAIPGDRPVEVPEPDDHAARADGASDASDASDVPEPEPAAALAWAVPAQPIALPARPWGNPLLRISFWGAVVLLALLAVLARALGHGPLRLIEVGAIAAVVVVLAGRRLVTAILDERLEPGLGTRTRG